MENIRNNTEFHPGKAQILQAAIRVFSEKGFERATTREIAAAAGMTTGALYHHYKNKDDLFYDAVKESAYFVHRLSFIAQDQHLKSPEEMLNEISDNIIHRLSKLDEQRLLVLLVAYALSKGGKILTKYQKEYRSIGLKVADMLVHSFGTAHPERLKVASTVLMAALDGLAMQYALGVLDIQDEAFKRGLVSYFTECMRTFLRPEAL